MRRVVCSFFFFLIRIRGAARILRRRVSVCVGEWSERERRREIEVACGVYVFVYVSVSFSETKVA